MFSFHLPRQNRFQVYVPLVIWMSFIFFLSSQPTLPGPPTVIWDFAFKKLAHIFVYFTLYRLMFRATSYDIKSSTKASMVAFALAILYSVSDEFHQSFIPGRTPTGKDILFDTLGMSIAWLSIFKYL